MSWVKIMSALATINPVVIVKDNQAFANSCDVAEFFEKEHGHVLRDIGNLEFAMKTNPDLGASRFAKLFRATGYMGGNGQLRPSFDMTRQGFTMLAMRFTVSKVLDSNETYAYNGPISAEPSAPSI